VAGETLPFGSARGTPVGTSHDAAEPVALVFDDGHHCAALCTDTGTFTALLEQRFQGCELLLLETNHDSDMLRHGPYPWPLKQRIASRVGHLANHQSQEVVGRLNSSVLRAVVGMHLSAENNRPDLVCQTLRDAAGNGVPVAAVTRSGMLRINLDGDGARLEPHALP